MRQKYAFVRQQDHGVFFFVILALQITLTMPIENVDVSFFVKYVIIGTGAVSYADCCC